MDARFSYDDDYVISVGGRDVSIFQWRHVIPNKVDVNSIAEIENMRGNREIPLDQQMFPTGDVPGYEMEVIVERTAELSSPYKSSAVELQIKAISSQTGEQGRESDLS
eukprot:483315-Hanusia_phi.AAC.3